MVKEKTAEMEGEQGRGRPAWHRGGAACGRAGPPGGDLLVRTSFPLSPAQPKGPGSDASLAWGCGSGTPAERRPVSLKSHKFSGKVSSSSFKFSSSSWLLPLPDHPHTPTPAARSPL